MQSVPTLAPGGPEALAADWREYFAQEPQAEVEAGVQGDGVLLDVRVCPAIKHLRDCGRDIVPYYCEHCDHICAAMAEQSGYVFQRTGGMGAAGNDSSACDPRLQPAEPPDARLPRFLRILRLELPFSSAAAGARPAWSCSGARPSAATASGTTPMRRHRAGLRGPLRGLYKTWVGTGEEENCDWTFTLDEEKNVLRWDMRECPSKGFLIRHDLNADEDYCNHCMGWIIPMLEASARRSSSTSTTIAANAGRRCG